jgi:hypothetical protein
VSKYTASFAFEAEDMEDAQRIVAGWEVTAGTTLNGLMVVAEMGVVAPVTVTQDGPIGDAILVHAQRVPPPPQPLPPPA